MVSYICDSYAGLDDSPEAPGRKRRVFLWEEADGIVYMGNTEAFTLHLGRKIGLPLMEKHASEVHMVLREMGERVLRESDGDRRRTNAKVGLFKQPSPDSWAIGGRRAEDRETE